MLEKTCFHDIKHPKSDDKLFSTFETTKKCGTIAKCATKNT